METRTRLQQRNTAGKVQHGVTRSLTFTLQMKLCPARAQTLTKFQRLSERLEFLPRHTGLVDLEAVELPVQLTASLQRGQTVLEQGRPQLSARLE